MSEDMYFDEIYRQEPDKVKIHHLATKILQHPPQVIVGNRIEEEDLYPIAWGDDKKFDIGFIVIIDEESSEIIKFAEYNEDYEIAWLITPEPINIDVINLDPIIQEKYAFRLILFSQSIPFFAQGQIEGILAFENGSPGYFSAAVGANITPVNLDELMPAYLKLKGIDTGDDAH